MHTINLELPDGLHERVLKLAERNQVSINLWVATALADRILTPRANMHDALGKQSNHSRQAADISR